MQANAQIVLRYCTPEGKVTPEANPNGSLDNIAGIINAEGNVDVLVALANGAITQITYTAAVDGGTAQVVTTISAVVDPTPIVAPI